MKIAMYGQKRVPSREGGVEIVVWELATRMADMGHNVTCINRRGHHVSGAQYDNNQINRPNGHKKRNNIMDGVEITSVPTIDKKGLAATSSAFFAAVKAAFGRYDVVHIHAEGPAAFCYIPKMFGKKVVVTCHGLDWARPRWKNSFGGKFIKYGERMAVKHADTIIVLSKGVKDYFRETYNRDTEFIPNGVNRPQIVEASEITDKWGITKDSYILTVARLTDEKKIHLLIEAYKQIKTDKKLVIAGGSSDSNEYVEKLHEMAADDDRIIFTDFVQGKVLEELYSNAYIYVLPSELEGMPLSLLEAMSYGNCCLTSDIAECVDVVGNNAVSFKKNDVDHLTDKLKELCDKKDMVENLKSQAADYICNKYNWDDVARETVKIYQS